MSATPARQEELRKINELIKGIRFAMLTSVDPDGTLHSRPMTTQQAEFDGDLWFFTGQSTDLVAQVGRNPRVNVAYADADKNRYVSLAGTGRVVRDRQKMAELWNPAFKAWFPDGLDDPDLVLLRVTAIGPESWDAPNGKVVQALGFAKALLTGQRYEGGENEAVALGPR